MEAHGGSEEIAAEYASALDELDFNSKPIINNLTTIADENSHAFQALVRVIEQKIRTVAPARKLPYLYLMDSIVKNIGGNYIHEFARNLVYTFCHALEEVKDPDTRIQFLRLLKTWPGVFPPDTVRAIEQRLRTTAQHDAKLRDELQFLYDSGRSIHVNPHFFQPPPSDDANAIRFWSRGDRRDGDRERGGSRASWGPALEGLGRPHLRPHQPHHPATPYYHGAGAAGSGGRTSSLPQPSRSLLSQPPQQPPLQAQTHYPSSLLPPQTAMHSLLSLMQQQQQQQQPQQQPFLGSGQLPSSIPPALIPLLENSDNFSIEALVRALQSQHSAPAEELIKQIRLAFSRELQATPSPTLYGQPPQLGMPGPAGLPMQFGSSLSQLPAAPTAPPTIPSPILRQIALSLAPAAAAASAAHPPPADLPPIPPPSQAVPSPVPPLAPPSSAPLLHSPPVSLLPPSTGAPIDLKTLLSTRNEALIDSLYLDIPLICTTCARRFKDSATLADHLDWHFVTQKRGRENKALSRKWLQPLEEWLTKRDTVAIESPGALFFGSVRTSEQPALSTVTPPSIGGANGARESRDVVPADDQHDTCPVCGEKFETFYDHHKEEWICKDAILHKPAPPAVSDETPQPIIVHRTCLPSLLASSGETQSSLTEQPQPQSSLKRPKDESDDADTPRDKRPKLEDVSNQ